MLDLETLLDALHTASVQFVVIGGVAAVSHGSAHVTGDLDVCYERTEANYERLSQALAPLKPHLRNAPPDLPFQWDAETLRKGMNFTLSTDAGPVDLLGHISGLGGYEAVKAQAESFQLYGRTTWVLSLEGLIRSKEATGRAKDERMLPELRSLQVLRETPGASPDEREPS